ncbi:hypothetical protein PNEG_02373 [Pneumocystis murina B123]|uniref:RRM domain-containing protein n=1 Tax=Pneumocystis murina (strain B123) TaxID=1069680 RepID=M7P6D6_PNEMU|nr:hypothetical protein PNEG_02373 [Pneumocystis murina B123]EMR09430.1 hypothetical protein PNEG_02373 [Pneumocystis murina B123]
MAHISRQSKTPQLPVLYVKNLSFKVSTEELFDLFGKFGPIRQIRLGNDNTTRGTAYVVYIDYNDAKMACEKLNGFNFSDRYLTVLYHQPEKISGKTDTAEDIALRQANLEKLKREYNIE